ncbi:MAG: hypothetical protein JXQ73_23155 [Phycisphaerae bacterium]|nr:hypothetical protein [Phycisphaerae bacterium]
MQRARHQAALALMAIAWTSAAPARVTDYTVSQEDETTCLTSVTVQRGGKTVVFNADRLIHARLVHFKAPQAMNLVVPAGATPPAPGRRDRLLNLTLNAGYLNPGSGDKPLDHAPQTSGPEATPGMAIAFHQPVTNLPGDDVVLFELQTRPNSPLAGDPVHVSPITWRDGLRSLTIRAYDIQFDDPKAKPLGTLQPMRLPNPPQGIDDLQNGPLALAGAGHDFKALAVAIDLADLGYRNGQTITGLFLQDADPGSPAVDPVCIAGLPAPEPPNVLAKAPPAVVRKSPNLLEQFLHGPLAGVDEIVFAVRVPGNDHWYANFGYYSSPQREYPPQRAPDGVQLPPIFKDGGRLCKLRLKGKTLRVLLDDPKGGVRDPQVHYDAHKILFSYRKGGQPYYHLYEINVDGTALTQLTDGPYNDFEPAYLPDGGIMFCSDRCRRFVNCWITPVATLYRCHADGTGIRMISSNIEHDNTPWVLPDGRILYTRWEYVDRSQSTFHHLWATNPDGTAQMVYFGNLRPGFTIIDAKPIPGCQNVLASFSPGHGRPEHAGFVTTINPALGPDDWSAVHRISRGGPDFRDPYALSDDCFLVAVNRELRLMDGQGRTETIYTLPTKDAKLSVHEPRPLRPRRRERVIPPRVDLSRPTGRLVLANIYEGRNMAGVKRGEVKELLVLEQLPKPVNFSGGMWPISIGGTFTLARVLGTVPVEPDGSAYMEVPALRSLFFVALDEKGLSVKRMHSFLTVQPGETTGCVGCHEKRVVPPPSDVDALLALGQPPAKIRPVDGVPDVFDFPRDIQPLLDKHCVSCHNPDRFDGRVDLCGDHSPLFSQSYWTITQHGLITDGRNEPRGSFPPRSIGSSNSPIMKLIDGSHHDAKLSPRERDTIRLWIESSAPYAGTYAALGSGMSPVTFPVDVIERRCGPCHAHEPKGNRRIGKNRYYQFGPAGPPRPLVHTFLDLQSIRAYIGYYKYRNGRPPQSLCNLTRPGKSLLLRAPLAKQSGGLGLCKPDVFATPDDADYQTILAAIRQAAQKLADEKRFDMPGFRPNDYYIHQMQRYGILPKDLQPAAPIDVYKTDEAYWRSFWYRPTDTHQPTRALSQRARRSGWPTSSEVGDTNSPRNPPQLQPKQSPTRPA